MEGPRNKEKKAQQAIDRVKGNSVDETNTAVEDITTGDIKAGYRIMIEFLLLKASSKDIVKAAKEFIQLFGKYPIKSLLLQNELTIRRKYNSIDWDNVMILADVIENTPVE